MLSNNDGETKILTRVVGKIIVIPALKKCDYHGLGR